MKTTLIALSLLIAAPFAASAAENLSYNHVEAGYMYTRDNSGEGSSVNADGWALNGSAAIAPNFHIVAGYSSQKYRRGLGDLDQWRLGLGYNHEVNSQVDLVSRASYERLDMGRGSRFNGFSIEAGANVSLNPNIEGYALVGYRDYSSSNGYNPKGEFLGSLGVIGKFNQNWGLAGEMKLVRGGYREWFIGPRYSW